MVCNVLHWNCSDFLSSKYCFARIKPEKEKFHTRILWNQQTIVLSYFCFILLIFLVNLGLIFHLQITSKKIYYRGRLKYRRGRFMEWTWREGEMLWSSTSNLWSATGAKRGESLRNLFLKDKQQNSTSGPSAEAKRTTFLIWSLSSTWSRTMGMSSYVIQRTTLKTKQKIKEKTSLKSQK